MKLKQNIRNYYFIVNSQEQYNKYVAILKEKNIPTANHNWSEKWKYFAFRKDISAVGLKLMAIHKDELKINVNTFEQWCKECIEGYIPETTPVQVLEPNQVTEWDKNISLFIKLSNHEQSKPVQEILFSIGYTWRSGATTYVSSYSRYSFIEIDAISIHRKFGAADKINNNQWMYAEDFIAKYGSSAVVPDTKESYDFKIGDVVELAYEISTPLGNELVSPKQFLIGKRGKIQAFSGEHMIKVEGFDIYYVKEHFKLAEPQSVYKEPKKIVYCIEALNKEITVGKAYEVIREKNLRAGEKYITIINDNGNETDYFSHRFSDTPPAIAKEESIPFYKKEGNKYTFEEGYKGEHPFKVGQRVIVHEGSNQGVRDVVGIIIKAETKNHGIMNPFISISEDNGVGRDCYPYDNGRKCKLIVTILSDKEEQAYYNGNGTIYGTVGELEGSNKLPAKWCIKGPISKYTDLYKWFKEHVYKGCGGNLIAYYNYPDGNNYVSSDIRSGHIEITYEQWKAVYGKEKSIGEEIVNKFTTQDQIDALSVPVPENWNWNAQYKKDKKAKLNLELVAEPIVSYQFAHKNKKEKRVLNLKPIINN